MKNKPRFNPALAIVFWIALSIALNNWAAGLALGVVFGFALSAGANNKEAANE